MIEISLAAAREIARVQQARNEPESLFRLRVSEGGCSGLIYSFDLESKSSEEADDNHLDVQGVGLVIDSKSYSYLSGLKLDYTEDLMGGGFRFQNPQAEDSCSCGMSFKLKASD